MENEKELNDFFTKNSRNLSLSFCLSDVNINLSQEGNFEFNAVKSSHYKTDYLIVYQNFKPITNLILNVANDYEIF